MKGTISYVKFRKDDYLIASFIPEQSTEEITIVGSIYGVDKGEEILIEGEWVYHPRFGKQFRVDRWERPLPTTKEQAIAFLSSSLIKGCGPKTAESIVEQLGAEVIDKIMEDGEEVLLNIKGIGKKRAKQITDSVRESFEVQKIVASLSKYIPSVNIIMKAYQKYQSNTVEVIMENPYVLINLNLIGFQTADQIAQNMGITPLSYFRIEACADYILKKHCSDLGHCYLPEEELIKSTLKELNLNAVEEENIVDEDSVRQAIYNLEVKGRFVFEDGVVYPRFLYEYEQNVAEKLSKMIGSADGEAMPVIEKAIKDYQFRHGIILANQQKQAITRLFQENVLILTGGAGTGKTTIIKAIVEIYDQIYPHNTIALSAPTGRASRRMEEVIGKPAFTIHSLLGFRGSGKPEFNQENTLPYDLFIIDETSMVDIQLANHLLNAIPNGAKVLFVGDADQLPSVNSGNFLKDMIDAGVPTVRLTEVFRQALESQIVVNSHRVNKGLPIIIDSSKNDFYFIEKEDTEEIAFYTVASALKFLKKGYSLSDVMVLSPMRRGVIGTDELNRRLQEVINPPNPQKQEWKIGNTTFRTGDKVIHLVNNRYKGVNNGDLGIIRYIGNRVNEDGEQEKVIIVDYNDKEVEYTKDDLNELNLAYSISIHKSQGSQAKVVISPISTSHYIMLTRNLIYTGMTRAEEVIVYIGTKKAMNIAIRNNKISKRNTKLSEKIQKQISKREQEKSLVNDTLFIS